MHRNKPNVKQIYYYYLARVPFLFFLISNFFNLWYIIYASTFPSTHLLGSPFLLVVSTYLSYFMLGRMAFLFLAHVPCFSLATWETTNYISDLEDLEDLAQKPLSLASRVCFLSTLYWTFPIFILVLMTLYFDYLLVSHPC